MELQIKVDDKRFVRIPVLSVEIGENGDIEFEVPSKYKRIKELINRPFIGEEIVQQLIKLSNEKTK